VQCLRLVFRYKFSWTFKKSDGFLRDSITRIWFSSLNKLWNLLRFGSNHFLRLSSLPESILEPPSQSLHVPHSSSTDSSPSLCLLSPVKITHFLSWVSARRACFLLDVIGNFSAATACRVGFVVAFSEWSGTLSLPWSLSGLSPQQWNIYCWVQQRRRIVTKLPRRLLLPSSNVCDKFQWNWIREQWRRCGTTISQVVA